MSVGDPSFKDPIFRNDFSNLIAKSIQRLVTLPVRLAYDSGGYVAGVVLARSAVDGFYRKYDDNGASTVSTAVCILADNVGADESSGTRGAVAIVHGELYSDALSGVDANGKTDMGARTYTDADGTVIFSF